MTLITVQENDFFAKDNAVTIVRTGSFFDDIEDRLRTLETTDCEATPECPMLPA